MIVLQAKSRVGLLPLTLSLNALCPAEAKSLTIHIPAWILNTFAVHSKCLIISVTVCILRGGGGDGRCFCQFGQKSLFHLIVYTLIQWFSNFPLPWTTCYRLWIYLNIFSIQDPKCKNNNLSMAQPRRAKTDWSGCCQMTVQGALYLAKLLSLTLISVFLTGFRNFSYQIATQLSSRGWVDPALDPILPEKFLGYSRESNPGPLGWESGVLTTIPNRRSRILMSADLCKISFATVDMRITKLIFIGL